MDRSLLNVFINNQLLSTCLKEFLDDSDRFILRLVCKDFHKLLPRRNNSNILLENFMKEKGYYYLYSIFFKPNRMGLYYIAFSTRDEDVQKELLLKNLSIENINSAAFVENLNIVKWLKENNCPWDDSIFFIAQNGNLNMMKWSKENNCPWYKWTFSEAANNGNLENMKWLLENNCPWDIYTFRNATKNGNLTNMKWLLDNNCPYDKNICLHFTNEEKIKEWINKNLQ